MTVAELVGPVHFVVDECGNKKSVLLDFEVWEELLARLEDIEDAEELKQARQEEDEVVPWEQVKADYLAAHPETNV